MIYSIEGNIGSGKSTLLKYLKEYLNPELFVFIQEPVEDWKEIIDPETKQNKIEQFYGDMKTHAFSFQMMAYISRLVKIKEALKKYPNKHIVVERSLYTDKNVFAKMLYEDKLISETDYQIYNKWFSHFIEEMPPIHYVYLQTNPAIALERIRKRNRSGEEGINMEYIQRCHMKHDEWLINIENKLIIDGNEKRNTKENYIQLMDVIKTYMITPIDLHKMTMNGQI